MKVATRAFARLHRVVQIAARNAAATAAALRDLIEPDALLLGAVEVVVGAMTRFERRGNEARRERVGKAQVGDAERAVRAVPRTLIARVAFRAQEVRQHV
jgi:cell division inhibitor SulA